MYGTGDNLAPIDCRCYGVNLISPLLNLDGVYVYNF